jgi:hypothetical protein
MPYFGIPIRNGLPIGLGSVAGFGVQQFSPADLFSAGEQGAWYDPSDLTTLFTDSAGTTPVTGVEQFVGRMNDKSGRGNHATQTTSAKRPKLAARYNLLTYSEQFDNGAWTKSDVTADATTATTDPLGGNTADVILESATTAPHFWRHTGGAVGGDTTYVGSAYVKSNGRTKIQMLPERPGGSQWAGVTFNLSNNTYNSTPITAGATTFISASIVDVYNGWKRITVTARSASGSFFNGMLFALLNDAVSETTVAPSYAGDITKGIYIWGADLRPASQATGLIGPTYQRVVDAATYDTAGFLPYLQFDGLDDSMSTNSIDFSAGDKMTVWAGVRKLSDANTGTVAQLSPSTSTNNGVFGLYVPFNTGASADYAWQSKGTLRITVNSSVSTGPATSVFTAIGNISAPLAQLRQNAIQIATSSASQGTGNFGNFALNIGEGAGFLNGWLTSLIVRGAQSTQSQIEATESWVAGKTGVSL